MSEETSPATTGVNTGGIGTRVYTSELKLLERQLRRQFPISEDDREKTVMLCRHVYDNCKSYRTKIMAGRLLALLDGQSMRDQHHLERIDQENGVMILKQQRAEMGLPNDSLAVILPPTTQTPMPAWMERMKGECPQ